MSRSVPDNPGFEQLRKRFSGTLLTPDGAAYEEARALFNAMITTRPALIAQCGTRDDVTAAIAFARDGELEIAVRAGGHSVAGMSSVDNGVTIDVRPMNEISIDPKARTARVGAGATWSEFDRAAQEHGLATTGGRVSTTGVAGFTLGGGSGWIERKYGLACDNLLSVDLTIANGEHVTASKTQHPELFWALHGGGGNFGVATSFEFTLHPVGPTVLAGLMMWSAAAGPDVAQAYRRLAEKRAREPWQRIRVPHRSARGVRARALARTAGERPCSLLQRTDRRGRGIARADAGAWSRSRPGRSDAVRRLPVHDRRPAGHEELLGC